MVRVSLPARMEKIVSSCSGRKEVYPQCFFKMALRFSLTGFRKILLYVFIELRINNGTTSRTQIPPSPFSSPPKRGERAG